MIRILAAKSIISSARSMAGLQLQRIWLTRAWSAIGIRGVIGTLLAPVDALIRFFNPRLDEWSDHFSLEGAIIKPLTPIGQVTERIFKLNATERLVEREALRSAGRYPSKSPSKSTVGLRSFAVLRKSESCGALEGIADLGVVGAGRDHLAFEPIGGPGPFVEREQRPAAERPSLQAGGHLRPSGDEAAGGGPLASGDPGRYRAVGGEPLGRLAPRPAGSPGGRSAWCCNCRRRCNRPSAGSVCRAGRRRRTCGPG